MSFPAEQASARIREINEDRARGEFLRSLRGAELAPFEMDFVSGFLGCLTPKNELAWWTPRRRATADEMRRKHRA